MYFYATTSNEKEKPQKKHNRAREKVQISEARLTLEFGYWSRNEWRQYAGHVPSIQGHSPVDTGGTSL